MSSSDAYIFRSCGRPWRDSGRTSLYYACKFLTGVMQLRMRKTTVMDGICPERFFHPSRLLEVLVFLRVTDHNGSHSRRGDSWYLTPVVASMNQHAYPAYLRPAFVTSCLPKISILISGWKNFLFQKWRPIEANHSEKIQGNQVTVAIEMNQQFSCERGGKSAFLNLLFLPVRGRDT